MFCRATAAHWPPAGPPRSPRSPEPPALSGADPSHGVVRHRWSRRPQVGADVGVQYVGAKYTASSEQELLQVPRQSHK